MYTYHEMTIEDYEEVYSIWSQTEGMGLSESDSEEEIGKFLRRNPGHSFVCKCEGKIVGTILCGHDARRGFLYHVAVLASHRNRGIGKTLVAKALESLRAAGIVKCHLMVFKDHEAGNQYWHEMGWQRREDILIYSRSI